MHLDKIRVRSKSCGFNRFAKFSSCFRFLYFENAIFFCSTSIIFVCACLALIYYATYIGEPDYSECKQTDTRGLSTDVFNFSHSSGEVYGGNMTEPWETDYRLPKDIIPLNYDILLHPDLDHGTFSGTVNIKLQITKSRNFVAVHTKYLEIYQTNLVKVEHTSKLDIAIKYAFEYKPNEFWVVTFKQEPISPGVYNLILKFKGKLTDKIVGFYKSVYKNSQTGMKRSMATSKFEPTYARQAFPCMDEPDLKATFEIKLVKPSNDYYALSNMDIEKIETETPTAGLSTVHFTKSVPMSTYLACFIVSDFESLQQVFINGKFPFTVYSSPNQKFKTEYALDIGSKITKHFISYFGLDYPLPKLDLIGIPDFVSGAMEHWGLITFRETNLLYHSSFSSAYNEQRIALVIAHELAHMWFGNLVTLKWWDDLWLNEGFASFMAFKGVKAIKSDWDMDDQFLIMELHDALELDASVSSHPIVQTVKHPDEITEMFDKISYHKGASIIRMLENFMEPFKFQKGISNYLQNFKFENAITQDLWNYLQMQAMNINVTRIMDTWTRQMGYPLVTAVQEPEGRWVLTQERFLSNPSESYDDSLSPYGYRWEIPLTYVLSNGSVNLKWMSIDDETVEITVPEQIKWIKFNHKQVGFYRVNYNQSGWDNFTEILLKNSEEIKSGDRVSLIDDAFSIAGAGLISYEIPLNLSLYLKNETSYVPWKVAAMKLKEISKLLSDTPTFPVFRKYIHVLVKNVFAHVGWDVLEENHMQRLLRVTVLNICCHFGYQPCVDEAGVLFRLFLGTHKKPHPDIRALVYEYGMTAVGSDSEWEKMWDLYLEESDAQERINLLQGLAAVKEPGLLKRFIELAKNENNVRSQDFLNVLSSIASHSAGNPVVWEFVRVEWNFLVQRYTLNDRYLGRLVPSVTEDFSTEFRLKEVENFYAQNSDAGAGKAARQQGLEKIRNNIKWVNEHSQNIMNWIINSPACKNV